MTNIVGTYTIGKSVSEVKETNGKYFYYGRLARRWMPVKKSAVVFNEVSQ